MTERSAQPSRSLANPRRTRHSAAAAASPATGSVPAARGGARVASALRCRVPAAVPVPGEQVSQSRS